MRQQRGLGVGVSSDGGVPHLEGAPQTPSDGSCRLLLTALSLAASGGLTFEQGQRSELLLVALVAELRGTVGPPGPGPAQGPAGEAIHLVGWRHR